MSEQRNESLPQRQDAVAEIIARRRQQPQLVAGAPIAALVPRTIDEVLRVADIILMAGIVPDTLEKEKGQPLPQKEIVARVVAVIMAGSEVGMGPMASLANIAIINKRRSIWGQGAVALLQDSGVLESMKVERIGADPDAGTETAKFSDDFGIRVTLRRRGQSEPYVGEYTVGKAKRAHLWMNGNKKPWIESPERQLQWRAFHFAATDGFADCLNGMMVVEVAADLASETPARTDTSFLDDAPVAALAPPSEKPVGVAVTDSEEEDVFGPHPIKEPIPVTETAGAEHAPVAGTQKLRQQQPTQGDLLGSDRAEIPVLTFRPNMSKDEKVFAFDYWFENSDEGFIRATLNANATLLASEPADVCEAITAAAEERIAAIHEQNR